MQNHPSPEVSRRQCLKAGAVAGLAWLTSQTAFATPRNENMTSQIRYCLNTSTVRGQNLSLEEEVDLAGAAGYDGIEPWIREIEAYQQSGKPLSDLKKRIADNGLRVESAIGFAQWIVNDDAQRKAGLEQLKREMELVKAIGGELIAAPPVGLHTPESPIVDLFAAADRYRSALEVGQEIGVTPQVEVWGFSKNLSRLGEAVFVAVEAGHPDACVLPDVYHIYKGGSRYEGLKLLSGQSIRCFHFNDYPANPPREQIKDADRVYPGDGIAPWPLIIQALKETGFSGAVSLELFNETYWKQDPKVVLETGLKKMKQLWSGA